MNSPAAIFGLIAQVRNSLYDHGALTVRRLCGPVVSVGNLSVGGSGKTPFVIMLGELLKERGITFDVLSRGYGRKSKEITLVDPHGSVQEFGDEPMLIARRMNVPVIVGGNRFRAGEFTEARFKPRLHILDDGFQHRALARDFDIVMLDSEDVSDSLLPKGRLREPLASLKRADAIVLTNGDDGNSTTLGGKSVWRIRRGISVQSGPPRAIVFCGIAKPHKFVAQLKTAGVEPVAQKFYRDHHAYNERDIEDLLQLRQTNGADGFVTTEKDAINLGARIFRLKPCAVASVTMELQDADDALDCMLRIIQKRKRST